MVELRDERNALLEDISGEPEGEGDLAGLERLQANRRVYVYLKNTLGRRVGNMLDFHTAFSRSNNDRARGLAVE
jgi:hypothetical protein